MTERAVCGRQCGWASLTLPAVEAFDESWPKPSSVSLFGDVSLHAHMAASVAPRAQPHPSGKQVSTVKGMAGHTRRFMSPFRDLSVECEI